MVDAAREVKPFGPLSGTKYVRIYSSINCSTCQPEPGP